MDGQPQGTMARRSEVIEKINELENRIGILDDEICALYEILAPILDIAPVSEKQHPPEQVEPMGSDLGMKLRNMIMQFDSGLVRLKELRQFTRL